MISGLEYAGLQEGTQRKGRIEQIRLDGFDPKSVMDAEGAPGDLPRVAENAVLTGWSDVSEEDGVKMSMSIESYAAKGWYQRLGVLLKCSSQEDLGPFLEEVLRYRLQDIVRSFRQSPGQLVLKADPEAPVEALVYVVDEVRMLGGEKLMVATSNPEDHEGPR